MGTDIKYYLQRTRLLLYIATFLEAALVLLFIYAALSKLLDFPAFRLSMYNQLFPRSLADVLLILLPVTELTTALLLVIPRTRTVGLVASLVLLTIFTGYIALVLLHFWGDIPCSCGGILSHMSWGGHLLFNCLFLIINISALAINFSERRSSDKECSL